MQNDGKDLQFSHQEIHEAIFRRVSTRRYAREPLPEASLQQVRKILKNVTPLVPENEFHCEICSSQGINLAKVMGAYGRIVNPPHFLVPYLRGARFALTDLGYRVQQIVIQLTAAGIATCYLGAISRQEHASQVLKLPADGSLGALLLFGKPANGFADQAFDNLIHNLASADKRLPVDQLFYDGFFNNPANPPQHLSERIEAARNAPSAVNAQPWRFLLANRLYLFVTRKNARYGKGTQDYRYYDAGICMANFSLAQGNDDPSAGWELLNPRSDDLPDHPEELEPIARIEV